MVCLGNGHQEGAAFSAWRRSRADGNRTAIAPVLGRTGSDNAARRRCIADIEAVTALPGGMPTGAPARQAVQPVKLCFTEPEAIGHQG